MLTVIIEAKMDDGSRLELLEDPEQNFCNFIVHSINPTGVTSPEGSPTNLADAFLLFTKLLAQHLFRSADLAEEARQVILARRPRP
jgi:hypothetical protein